LATLRFDEFRSTLVKLLINGASGMLGSEFVLTASKQGHEVIALTRQDCDITLRDDVLRIVKQMWPEAIIHCAAHTDVDDCERNPDHASRVNADAPGHFAEAARQGGCCLLYVGSSGIFDGKKTGPYTENDPPGPLTQYARSKLEGEKRVALVGCDHLIVRTGWLFGGSASFKKNFVAARRREAAQKPVLQSAADKRGSPTWTRDFAQKSLELLACRARGLFHVVNADSASRFEYVAEIVSLLGLDTKVEPVDSSSFARLAPVPDNEALASVRLPQIGVPALRPWRDALKEYAAELRREGA
jgi:dTDP-4-dehydrorhamnose reductase